MTKIQYYIFLFLTSAICSSFALVFPGRCPNAKPLTNFTEPQFIGKWFEISRFPNRLITGECGLADYTKSNNRTKGFRVNFLHTNLQNKKNATVQLELRKINNGTSNDTADYDVYTANRKNFPQYVLSTDYRKYSVVWGCSNNTNNTNTQHVSIFSRTKTLDKGTYDMAIRTLKSNNINGAPTRVQQDDKVCGRKKGRSEDGGSDIHRKPGGGGGKPVGGGGKPGGGGGNPGGGSGGGGWPGGGIGGGGRPGGIGGGGGGNSSGGGGTTLEALRINNFAAIILLIRGFWKLAAN